VKKEEEGRAPPMAGMGGGRVSEIHAYLYVKRECTYYLQDTICTTKIVLYTTHYMYILSGTNVRWRAPVHARTAVG
jgi:hypothetical protein